MWVKPKSSEGPKGRRDPCLHSHALAHPLVTHFWLQPINAGDSIMADSKTLVWWFLYGSSSTRVFHLEPAITVWQKRFPLPFKVQIRRCAKIATQHSVGAQGRMATRHSNGRAVCRPNEGSSAV